MILWGKPEGKENDMNPSERIARLEGADRVRRRPAVMFGSADATGAANMAKLLLDVFAREAVEGNCTKIELQVHGDASISVKSHDRGLWLGPGCVPEQSCWYAMFCELFAGSIYEREVGRPDWYVPPWERKACERDVAATESSISLCAVQYATEYMQVEVVRDGECKRLFFERGNYVSGPEAQPCREDAYTLITYRPDPAVFTDIVVPECDYMALVRQLAFLIPGLICVFRDSQGGQVEFCYPGGLADYAAEFAGERALSPVLLGRKCAQDGAEVDVRAAVCFVSGDGAEQCWHNLYALRGGAHMDLARELIVRYVSGCVGAELTAQELEPHVILMVDSRAQGAVFWQNGCRTGIGDVRVERCVCDILNAEFFRDSQAAAKRVGEKILAHRS